MSVFPINLNSDFNSGLTLQHFWDGSALRPRNFEVGSDKVELKQLSGYEHLNLSDSNEIKTFEHINSLSFGSCASFVLKKGRDANQILLLGFQYPNWFVPENVVFILHGTPGERYSLIPGDALSPGSKVEKVKLGEMKSLAIDVTVKERNVQRERGHCKDYDPDDSQAKCYLDKVLQTRFQNFSTESIEICTKTDTNFTGMSGICLIPQAYNVLKYHDESKSVPQCTTETEYLMMNLLTTNPKQRNEVCPKPCSEITYQTTSTTVRHDLNVALVEMFYLSDRMSLLEEYLIFDFASILVAIGGSLGLFLGFSLFQSGSQLLDVIVGISFKWMKNTRKKLDKTIRH